ncbi:hypothetical protein HFO93_24520 [Rhizobium leguminosarum]|uniref:hypothetical protein n=1 Tax=Rhizobium leguminosarum TaxID=384 RepID=UPI001441CCF3|nr:hypothetical protein [Rhizobium leguminosarum]MBY5446580.1 hypothetical protein [Rhizobium leguminosarum]MBY5780815.1 hypothetical protein [Rhizobium leguminosarum]MBY5796305.1 hypothetical protein [Rhizobium leguminosarum]NKK80559.1 hypothetical protein [Rhizobium leguminosarum bv. viciae]
MTKGDLVHDQRTRRSGEIRSAALAYVRECGRRRDVLDIAEFARQRWPRDGAAKLDVMTQALAADVDSGIPVVDVWRRFELPGRIAQRLIGASGYQALYDVLQSNSMPPGFTPSEIGRWVREGRLPVERAAEILGITTAETEDLIIRLRDPDA